MSAPVNLQPLAASLSLSVESLSRLGVRRDGAWWSWPERNADGEISGWARRDDAGNKKFNPGGHRGLTLEWPLPAYAGATALDPILVVEGMSDVASALDLGFTAIGRPGALDGLELLQTILRDRHAVIVGENDSSGAGRRGAEKMADGLAGVAASVRVICPPVGIKDLRELWFDRQSDGKEPSEVQQEVLDRAALVEPMRPRRAESSSRLRVVNMADVQPESLRWLWPGRVPLGKLTLLYGDPGLGKSFITMDIAARVSSGAGWPDDPHGRAEPGGVMILSAEDGLADTIRPRLDAAGADATRIEAIEAVGLPGGGERALNLADDLRLIEERIAERGDVRLLIIDPVSAYCGRADSHTNAEVRGMLAPIAKLAERHEVAIVAVSHLNKGAGGRALYRAMGSLAFIAAARAGWLVVEDESEPAKRLMLPTKMNLAAKPGGLAFSLRDSSTGIPCVAWDAEPVDLLADDALAAVSGRGEGRTARDDAADWLRAALADGPMPAEEVKRQAKVNAISESTLRRAKKPAGVQARKLGFGDGAKWVWELIGASKMLTNDEDAHSLDVSAFDESERLCEGGRGKSRYDESSTIDSQNPAGGYGGDAP